jgi:hypothetical protein
LIRLATNADLCRGASVGVVVFLGGETPDMREQAAFAIREEPGVVLEVERPATTIHARSW